MLPFFPAPLPNEWIGSWVARVAIENEMDMFAFLEALDIDSTQAVSAAGIRALAGATGHSTKIIKAMQTPSYPLLETGLNGGRPPAAVFGVRYVQVCPPCLQHDPVPFIRLDWVRRTVAACPLHGGPLRVVCPGCKSSLQVGPPVRLSRRLRNGLESSLMQTLRECRWCGGDLGQQEGQQRQFVPVLNNSRILGGKRASADQWDSFHSALWTAITTFGVTDLMEPGHIEVGQYPRYLLNPHTPEARLKAQALTAWLLQKAESGFVNRGRIRTTAQKLQIVLMDINVGSWRRWLYLSWLLTRLVEDKPKELLLEWPRLVDKLVARMAQPRQAISYPPRPIVLTDEQWEVILNALEQTSKQLFTNLLHRAVYGGGYVNERGAVSVQERTQPWNGSAKLGLALEMLFEHLIRTPGQYFPGLRGWASRPADDWRSETARLFASDGVIELTWQVNRALHRKVVMAL